MRIANAMVGLVCLSLLSGCGGGNTIGLSRYIVSGLAPATYFNGRAATINSSGQVASTTRQPGGDNTTARAFLYNSGAVQVFGTLGGKYSYGNGVNTAGEIVGSADLADGNTHAFVAKNGVLTDLGSLGGSYSYAEAINNKGQIAGESAKMNGPFTSSSVSHAFLYQNGAMTDLGVLPGDDSSDVTDLNDAGQVIGTSNPLDYSQTHGYLYSNGKMTNLGTLGGNRAYPLGINQQGQIVGVSDLNAAPNRTSHAFLYQNNKMIDLGTDGNAQSSKANDINNRGQIVGQLIDIPGSSTGHALLYQNGKMIDLNTLIDNYSPDGSSGWLLAIATGINDRGQIVGLGIYNGQDEIFLLSPR